VDLEAAVAALAPRLVAYAYARTASREEAEDIAQEALTALVRRWRHRGPPDSVEAFVFSIAKRRANRAVIRRALMAPLDAVRDPVCKEPSAEDTLDARSELGIVVAALRQLKRRDREALLLRVVGELDFEHIAAVMGTSTAAVKMRISRARRRLAALMPERSHGRRSHTA
jgi:RNA polymerase sigma-70 factor (ECF subfamily)